MSIWWSLHLRREAASVPLARRLLLGAMDTAGVDPDVSFDLSVALTEACANAVEHGGGGAVATAATAGAGATGGSGNGAPAVTTAIVDSARTIDSSGTIDSSDEMSGGPAGEVTGGYRVTAYLDGERCRIEVADMGPGFPARRVLRPTLPEPAPTAENGRGLRLIEQLADHVHFRNGPGHGAVVSFDKILKWREDALLRAM
ncbi:ATP-binding protein [Streptomyces sp. NRRL F-5135]|uniref:ATP-binding protein n=1 Tax=Streptomyces sp. NRRL F-5135 TaxID=1463858 RepID=UPI0004C9A7CF|nr:ATP-binding protein [Streptomyces sp. NRRL F-5135]